MSGLYGVVLFHTTSSALRGEKELKKIELRVKLIPVPRQFSSDCGIAIRFGWADQEKVRAALESARVEMSGLFQM